MGPAPLRSAPPSNHHKSRVLPQLITLEEEGILNTVQTSVWMRERKRAESVFASLYVTPMREGLVSDYKTKSITKESAGVW